MFKRLLDSVAQAADQVKESVSDAFDSTKEAVSNATDRVVDVVSDAYDATITTVSETSEKAVTVASDAYDATKEAVANVADKVVDGVCDAYDATLTTVTETSEKAATAASNAFDVTQNTVSSAADVVADAIADTYESTRDALSSGFDASKDYVSNFGQSMTEFWASRKNRQDAKVKEAESRGEAKAKAFYLERENRFESALEKATSRIKDNDSYFRMLIAMQAVAQACAASDGQVSRDKQEQIDELLLGMGAKWLPPQVRGALDAQIDQPPSLKEAFAIAQAIGAEAQDLFQEVIRFVIHLDDEVTDAERQFLSHWVQLRASA
ncbi:hypothetical protein LOY28_15400 [Pseudomonas sp. B21-017]|uniref:hypothetical protein n=1 Tax=Pseudomonas sp. B21-017 TaxID=2895474 RepID=UPI00215E537D|nr:hypothetical protein [Pseudomonas sp. B21-017]UVM36126.1 hypothetical protein LOY28_15400 [Pseudomonas sp. B21-017]